MKSMIDSRHLILMTWSYNCQHWITLIFLRHAFDDRTLTNNTSVTFVNNVHFNNLFILVYAAWVVISYEHRMRM